jgi:hypothetical protein
MGIADGYQCALLLAFMHEVQNIPGVSSQTVEARNNQLVTRAVQLARIGSEDESVPGHIVFAAEGRHRRNISGRERNNENQAVGGQG